MRSKWLRGFLMAGIAACMLLTVALAGTFSVTLPTALPVSVDAEGNVTTAEPVIKNTGGMTVTVAAATVEPLDGWTIVPWGTDFGKLPVSSKKFAMQFYGSEVPADGVIKLPSQSTIPVGGSAAVVYDARIAVQSAATEDLTIANCCIVVDSDEPEVPSGAVMAANSSWYKSSTPKASITEIEIVDSYTPTGTEAESWDASAAGDGSVMAYLNGTKLTLAGNGTGKIYANPDASWAFSDAAAMEADEPDFYSAVASITGLELLDTSAVTSAFGMFAGCGYMAGTPLTLNSLTNWNTSRMVSMSYMFALSGVPSLDLSGWDTRATKDMSFMLGMCEQLISIDFSGFDTSAVETMEMMFYYSPIKELTLGAKFAFVGEDHGLGATEAGVVWMDATTDITYTTAELSALTRTGKVTYVAETIKALAHQDTWYKGSTAKSVVTGIELLDAYTPTGEETESWDASEGSDGSVMAYISGTKLILAGNGSGKIIANPYSSSAFSSFTTVSSIQGLEILDTSAVTDMGSLFYGCSSLTSLDLSSFVISANTDMTSMFQNCSALTEIKGIEKLNTSAVTNMSRLFEGCSSLKSLDLSGWDTSATTDMSGMFSGTSINRITLGAKFVFVGVNSRLGNDSTIWCEEGSDNTYSSTELYAVIRESTVSYYAAPVLAYRDSWYKGNTDKSTITEIEIVDSYTPTGEETESWDASEGSEGSVMAYVSGTKLTLAGNGNKKIYAHMYFSDAFSGFNALIEIKGIEKLNTSSATEIYSLFEGCKSLTSIDLSSWDTSAVTNMGDLFNGCSSLTTIDLSGWDTSATTNMSRLFGSCSALTEIKGIEQLNTSAVTDMSSLFSGCRSLTSLDLSSWDTSATTDMEWMFPVDYYYYYYDDASGTHSKQVWHSTLDRITLGAKFHFVKDYAPMGSDDGNRALWRQEGTESVYTTMELYDLDRSEKVTYINGSLVLKSGGNWYKGTADRSAITEIELVGTYTPTGEETESWDISRADDGSVMAYISGTKLILAGDGVGKVYMSPTAGAFFSGFKMATSISGLSLLDVSYATTMGFRSGISGMFEGCSSLTSLDLSGWDTSAVTTMDRLFFGCSALTEIKGIEQLNTSAVSGFSGAFYKCSSLKSLDLSGWDTRKADRMDNLFSGCSALTEIKGIEQFNTSAVTDMGSLFGWCSSLTSLDLSGWDVAQVTSMGDNFLHAGVPGLTRGMFAGCSSLTSLNLAGWDTSSLLNMSSMFYYCSTLTEIKGIERLNTSAVTNMSRLFEACSSLTSLDLSGWDTSATTNMSKLFSSCSALTEIKGIEQLNTLAVTDMSDLFRNCSLLTSLDVSGWDTSKVTNMSYMFAYCTSLETIHVGNGWSTVAVTSSNNMFSGCTNLQGAIAYDSTKIDATYANYETGYLTYKAAPEGAEQVIAPAGGESKNGSSAGADVEIEPTPEETQEDAASADGKDEQTAEPPDEGGSAAGIILTLALPAAWKGVLYGKTK